MGEGGGDGLTKGLVCGEEVLELMCRDGGGGRGWSHQGLLCAEEVLELMCRDGGGGRGEGMGTCRCGRSSHGREGGLTKGVLAV